MKQFTLTFFLSLSLITLMAQDYYIYSGDSEQNQVKRMTIDGTVSQVLFTINTPREIELDEANGKLWYIDGDTFQILKCDLDGSNHEAVISDLANPSSLFLDHYNQRVFYSNAADSSIHVCDWTGQNDFEIIQGEGRVTHVEYDYCSKKVFWSDFENSRIASVNVDGTELETVVSDITLPKNFEIDVINQKLYWVTSGTEAKLVRADMNGDNQEDLYSLASGTYASIKIDLESQTLFCLDQGLQILVRMNLDGTDVQMISDNFLVVSHLAIASCRPLAHCEDVVWCSNSGYNFEGDTLYEEGTFSTVLNSANNCDSLSLINLSILPSVNTGIEEFYELEMGESLNLLLDSNFEDVSWSDGSTGNEFIFNSIGQEDGVYTFSFWASHASHRCGLSATFSIYLGITAIDKIVSSETALLAYPNPIAAGEILNLNLRDTSIRHIEWINSIGTSVSLEPISGGRILTPEVPGIYILRVLAADGSVRHTKIVVRGK